MAEKWEGGDVWCDRHWWDVQRKLALPETLPPGVHAYSYRHHSLQGGACQPLSTWAVQMGVLFRVKKKQDHNWDSRPAAGTAFYHHWSYLQQEICKTSFFSAPRLINRNWRSFFIDFDRPIQKCLCCYWYSGEKLKCLLIIREANNIVFHFCL